MLRFAITVLAVVLALPALAAEAPQFTIRIENHRFVPAELIVPAGQKMKLVIENRDDSAEEFESYELNREKIVGPKLSITVWVGPLKPGRYPFFGEFNVATAQGALIAQ